MSEDGRQPGQQEKRSAAEAIAELSGENKRLVVERLPVHDKGIPIEFLRGWQGMQQRIMEQQQAMFMQMLEKVTSASASSSMAATTSVLQGTVAEAKAEKLSSLLHGSIEIDEERLAAASVVALGKRDKATDAQMVCVKTVAATFRKDLNLLLNAEFRLESLKAKQVTLNEGGVPAGVKPYKPPNDYEVAEGQSPHAGTTINIVIPDEATQSEVREILYLKCLSLTSAVDIDIENLRKAELSKKTSLSSFLVEVKAKLLADAKCAKKFSSSIDAPAELLESDQDAVRRQCGRTMLSRGSWLPREPAVNPPRRKMQTKSRGGREKVANLTPEQVLEEKFKQIMEKTVASKASFAQTKNGVSPGAARG